MDFLHTRTQRPSSLRKPGVTCLQEDIDTCGGENDFVRVSMSCLFGFCANFKAICSGVEKPA